MEWDVFSLMGVALVLYRTKMKLSKDTLSMNTYITFGLKCWGARQEDVHIGIIQVLIVRT